MRKLIYLLPFVIMAFSACTKTADNAPVAVPTGTFTGEFRVVHLNNSTQKLDTTKRSNLILTISQATGYKVTGDTVLYHAGSYGDFAVGSSVIQFIDKTIPANASGVLPKIHLSGNYQYAYDGTNFIIQAANDTLAYQYVLKKSAN